MNKLVCFIEVLLYWKPSLKEFVEKQLTMLCSLYQGIVNIIIVLYQCYTAQLSIFASKWLKKHFCFTLYRVMYWKTVQPMTVRSCCFVSTGLMYFLSCCSFPYNFHLLLRADFYLLYPPLHLGFWIAFVITIIIIVISQFVITRFYFV